jgi:hypothetical protein
MTEKSLVTSRKSLHMSARSLQMSIRKLTPADFLNHENPYDETSPAVAAAHAAIAASGGSLGDDNIK